MLKQSLSRVTRQTFRIGVTRICPPTPKSLRYHPMARMFGDDDRKPNGKGLAKQALIASERVIKRKGRIQPSKIELIKRKNNRKKKIFRRILTVI